MTPDDSVLDNAVWHALRERQSQHAEWNEQRTAVRFDPEVNIFSGVDAMNARAWDAQAELVGPGGMTVLFRPDVPSAPSGWQEVFRETAWQMVADGPLAAPTIDPRVLSAEDVPDMLALTKQTEPGPFLVRTHELGTYVGVREEGRLLAMAGERLRPPGFTEVSAVCTHPNAQRRGLGAALTLWVTQQISARGETAFLHVLENNENALRLYEALGFRRRRRVDAVAALRQD